MASAAVQGAVGSGWRKPRSRSAQAKTRIHEAMELDGVHVFTVTCPKDVTMYSDAVKTTGHENVLVVKDLIELVHEAL